MSSRRYHENEVIDQRFFKLPKELMCSEKYKGLSDSAKVTYAILRDRHDLSLKNRWIDESGNVFIYYDGRKLAKMQGRSPATISKNKKLLKDFKLIEDERQGQGKPNRLYVLKPESVGNSLMHNNCKSRNTKDVNLEIQSLVQSETEVSETEKKETEGLLVQAQDYLNSDFGTMYLSIYREVFTREHPRINEQSIADIEEGISFITEYVEEEDYEELIRRYFDELPLSNNGNIISFVKGKHRHGRMW